MEINFKTYPLPKKMRHHTAPNLYLPFTELKNLPDYYPPVLKKVEWEKIFINCKKPDFLDIGCGKGNFLLNYGELNQDKNILGIEVRKPLQTWLDSVIQGERIPNCAVIWYSVVNGLPFIETESIEKIFYLFPDPWHKRKHYKRRAFNKSTVQEFHRILKSGGHLYLATDVNDVNEYHIKTLSKFKGFDYRIVEDDLEWTLPITNKEKFCVDKQIDIHRIICRKM